MNSRLHKNLSFETVKDAERHSLPGKTRGLSVVLSWAGFSLSILLAALLFFDRTDIFSSPAEDSVSTQPALLPFQSKTEDREGNDRALSDLRDEPRASVALRETPGRTNRINGLDEQEPLLGDLAISQTPAVSKIAQDIKVLQDRFAATDTRLDEFGQAMGRVDNQLSRLGSLVESTVSEVRIMTRSFDKKNRDLNQTVSAIQQKFEQIAGVNKGQNLPQGEDKGSENLSNLPDPDLLSEHINKQIDERLNLVTVGPFPERRTALLTPPTIPLPDPLRQLASARRPAHEEEPIITASIINERSSGSIAQSEADPVAQAQQAAREAISIQLARKHYKDSLIAEKQGIAPSPLSESVLALDLGRVDNLDQVRAVWNLLIQTNAEQLTGLVPAVTIVELSRGKPELRLLAGPVAGVDRIANLCAKLKGTSDCRPALFEGTRVSLR